MHPPPSDAPDTLTIPPSGPPVDPGGAKIDDAGFTERYQLRALLGQGGMGEVHLFHDRRIGRDIAIKMTHPGRGEQDRVRSRFVREVRVQGQLEHPAIVPVYDLGLTPTGEMYFAMKCVRGVSLRDVLKRLRARDPETVRAYSRHRLLTAFSTLCLAVDYAHARGVLHRDLKPSNVMLGGFGEVSLLDWGIAKIIGAQDSSQPDAIPAPTGVSQQTAVGELMGTPGYMAPEQVRPDVGPLDARTDVYALGAILFEILTLEPLHGRGTPLEKALAAALGADARASVRKPEAGVLPMLEAICVKATARLPQDRYPSARALHEALEAVLDGHRDGEMRRRMARQHLEAAQDATDKALMEPSGQEERTLALRELGRALVLDPSQTGAIDILLRLLAQPPSVVPLQAREAIDRAADHMIRLGHRTGALAATGVLATLGALLLWMGIRDWLLFGCMALFATAMLVSAWSAASTQRPRAIHTSAALLFGVLAIALHSRLLGAFIQAPLSALVLVMAVGMHPNGELRRLALVLGCMAILAPAGLEWLGMLPPSYVFRDGAMVVLPQMAHLSMLPTQTFLLLGSLLSIGGMWVFVSLHREALTRAEERLHVHAWHLGQLVPQERTSAHSRGEMEEPVFIDQERMR